MLLIQTIIYYTLRMRQEEEGACSLLCGVFFFFFSEQSFETLFALKILIEKQSLMSGFLFYSKDVILLCKLVSHLNEQISILVDAN